MDRSCARLHVVRHEGEINHHVEMAESLVVGELIPFIPVDAEFRYVEAAGRLSGGKFSWNPAKKTRRLSMKGRGCSEL